MSPLYQLQKHATSSSIPDMKTARLKNQTCQQNQMSFKQLPNLRTLLFDSFRTSISQRNAVQKAYLYWNTLTFLDPFLHRHCLVTCFENFHIGQTSALREKPNGAFQMYFGGHQFWDTPGDTIGSNLQTGGLSLLNMLNLCQPNSEYHCCHCPVTVQMSATQQRPMSRTTWTPGKSHWKSPHCHSETLVNLTSASKPSIYIWWSSMAITCSVFSLLLLKKVVNVRQKQWENIIFFTSAVFQVEVLCYFMLLQSQRTLNHTSGIKPTTFGASRLLDVDSCRPWWKSHTWNYINCTLIRFILATMLFGLQ